MLYIPCSPLLEEKLEIERDHMTDIASRQQEVRVHLPFMFCVFFVVFLLLTGT